MPAPADAATTVAGTRKPDAQRNQPGAPKQPPSGGVTWASNAANVIKVPSAIPNSAKGTRHRAVWLPTVVRLAA